MAYIAYQEWWEKANFAFSLQKLPDSFRGVASKQAKR